MEFKCSVCGILAGVSVLLLYLANLYIESITPDKEVAHYSWPMKAFAAVLTFGSLLCTYMCLSNPQNDFIEGLLVCGGLLIATAYIVLEFYFVRIEISDNGLRTHSPWRKHRSIPWDDIQSVDYSLLTQSAILRTKTQGKVCVSEYLCHAYKVVDAALDVVEARS